MIEVASAVMGASSLILEIDGLRGRLRGRKAADFHAGLTRASLAMGNLLDVQSALFEAATAWSSSQPWIAVIPREIRDGATNDWRRVATDENLNTGLALLRPLLTGSFSDGKDVPGDVHFAYKTACEMHVNLSRALSDLTTAQDSIGHAITFGKDNEYARCVDGFQDATSIIASGLRPLAKYIHRIIVALHARLQMLIEWLANG